MKNAWPSAIIQVLISKRNSHFGLSKYSTPFIELGKDKDFIVSIKNNSNSKGIIILFNLSIPFETPK